MSAALLSTDGLSFSYEATAPLLQSWSADFQAGEVVAVTGPSGRGKSTLLYLLGLMLKPAAGRVLLDGEPVHALPDRTRAHLRASVFGFVFQDSALDASRTVMDNILETVLYRNESRVVAAKRAEALMEQFSVGLRAGAKPGQVSGGQAQRIALCRALIGDPRILLADEPTGNLDPSSSDIVIQAMHDQAARGAAVIVVTHDPALVARCHRKIEL
ncbi:ABC transporter [Leifsonia sp. Root4]|uniref:ABC transporter ATP-binding protein n=1 Tax=Leifsonia sp. Root4 TaxID=1736525 RepID=UPI0006F3702E|nr:ATP-binding cassette domain-containing protein [Leifsonia sp. Root4]KQW08181.1 ABC transporter [Leifsonia sp. Root4]